MTDTDNRINELAGGTCQPLASIDLTHPVELREATEALDDPAVNNLRTLPEGIRLLHAEIERLRRDYDNLLNRDTANLKRLIAAYAVNERLRSRLAEAERNEGTLLGMIHHQRDVLRECLPYLNESMAGKRPGRSADDIRAAVKALTSASADGPKGEK